MSLLEHPKLLYLVSRGRCEHWDGFHSFDQPRYLTCPAHAPLVLADWASNVERWLRDGVWYVGRGREGKCRRYTKEVLPNGYRFTWERGKPGKGKAPGVFELWLTVLEVQVIA